MERREFELLRDLLGKRINGDILLRRSSTRPYLESESTPVDNTLDIEVFVLVRWNPETDAKTVNVHLSGVGPICRLDVDATVHKPAGRDQKHALQTSRCPEQNLPQKVVPRDDLSGKPIELVFAEFCRLAKIEHDGLVKVED